MFEHYIVVTNLVAEPVLALVSTILILKDAVDRLCILVLDINYLGSILDGHTAIDQLNELLTLLI